MTEKLRHKAIMKREHGEINLGGNNVSFKGRWVLRSEHGNYIDHDKYRNDLKERHEHLYEIQTIGN